MYLLPPLYRPPLLHALSSFAPIDGSCVCKWRLTTTTVITTMSSTITLAAICCVCRWHFVAKNSRVAGRRVGDRGHSVAGVSATSPTAMRGRPSPCTGRKRCPQHRSRSSGENQPRLKSSVFGLPLTGTSAKPLQNKLI